MQIWCQFRIKIYKIAAETAYSNGAIWDEFSEQYKHQSIKIRCQQDSGSRSLAILQSTKILLLPSKCEKIIVTL